jgi:hypothetical protein
LTIVATHTKLEELSGSGLTYQSPVTDVVIRQLTIRSGLSFVLGSARALPSPPGGWVGKKNFYGYLESRLALFLEFVSLLRTLLAARLHIVVFSKPPSLHLRLRTRTLNERPSLSPDCKSAAGDVTRDSPSMLVVSGTRQLK